MTEQLTLEQAASSAPPPAAPSAWLAMRERNPGMKLMRVIDLEQQKQAFVEVDNQGFAQDGATVIKPSIPGGRNAEEFDAIVAEYDRKWQDEEPAA